MGCFSVNVSGGTERRKLGVVVVAARQYLGGGRLTVSPGVSVQKALPQLRLPSSRSKACRFMLAPFVVFATRGLSSRGSTVARVKGRLALLRRSGSMKSGSGPRKLLYGSKVDEKLFVRFFEIKF